MITAAKKVIPIDHDFPLKQQPAYVSPAGTVNKNKIATASTELADTLSASGCLTFTGNSDGPLELRAEQSAPAGRAGFMPPSQARQRVLHGAPQ